MGGEVRTCQRSVKKQICLHHRHTPQTSDFSKVICPFSLHVSKASRVTMTETTLLYFIIHNKGISEEGLGEVIMPKPQLFASLP